MNRNLWRDSNGKLVTSPYEEGTTTTTTAITAVTPPTAKLNTATTFTLSGSNLPNDLRFSLSGCANTTEQSGGNAIQRQFQCTPQQSGEQSGLVRDSSGTTLYSFKAQVNGSDAAQIRITNISPQQANLGENTIFTVIGDNLTDDMGFTVRDCAPSSYELPGGTDTQRQFQCTPQGNSGSKTGIVKDHPGGMNLYSFAVQVNDPNQTQATISSVSPLTTKVGDTVTFTVTGINLSDSMGFSVNDCAPSSNELPGGTDNQRQFQCTQYGLGGQKFGVVKDRPAGTELYEFIVKATAEDGNQQPTPPSPTTERVINVPQPLLDNAICTAQACKFEVNIDQVGFYIVTARLLNSNTEGFWGVGINTTTGVNVGGFNAGAILKENGEAPGFVAFYLSEPETVKLIPYEYSSNVANLTMKISQQDLTTGERQTVFGPITTPPNTEYNTTSLAPGFYVAEVLSSPNDPRGRFGLTIGANSILGGVNIGGWIDDKTGGNGEGFGAFYIDSPQVVNVEILFGDTYGGVGAGYVQVEVYRQLNNGERELYFTSNSTP